MVHDQLVSFCGHEFDCVDTGFGEQAQVDVVIRPEAVSYTHLSCSMRLVFCSSQLE